MKGGSQVVSELTGCNAQANATIDNVDAAASRDPNGTNPVATFEQLKVESTFPYNGTLHEVREINTAAGTVTIGPWMDDDAAGVELTLTEATHTYNHYRNNL